MKRLSLLFAILILTSCGLNSTSPSTLIPATAISTLTSPATVPPVVTSIPPTAVPPNTGSFPDPSGYSWKEIANGLARPLDLQADGSGRLFIVENPGRIRIFQNGQLSNTPFLDITDRVDDSGNEMGLLGLAFHPNYAQNGFFYVNYTGKGGDTRISRFHASGDVADPNSEDVLLIIKQPFPNHNGGALAFGPDGYLYAGLGDGGSQGDPFGNAQKTDTLLGKILRLDVDSAEPYSVPSDNPFGNEIWAYGLRNPWRMSFDKLTGDLYIGDVGQNDWEEIDYIPAGARGGLNFGWNYYEGNHDYKPQGAAGEFTSPVVEYSHAEGGCAVTGGYVYRGSMPEWKGIYLYGDYCSGKVWGLVHSGTGWQTQLLFDTDSLITSFGQDASGEVYMLSDSGSVYELVRK